MPEKAEELMQQLQPHFMCQCDMKDAIGRRYRRQDAIGTPFCVTIDSQTMEDDTVTIRERDTMQQYRVNINELVPVLLQKLAK